jgi:hypothetical protein
MRWHTGQLRPLLVFAAFPILLTGCDLHDKAWETERNAAASPHSSADNRPAPAPAGREVTIVVSSNGSASCRVDGAALSPINRDDLVRDPNAAGGARLLIVQERSHDTDSCFPVAVDLDGADATCSGRATIHHVNHNLIVEANGAARVTLFPENPQEEVDACVEFAGDDDIDRLADRLDANPELIDGRDSKFGRTALGNAAEQGRVGVTEFLLRRKANTEVRDLRGLTPLHAAVARGRTEVVKRLISHGADVNARTPSGSSPLQLAEKYGRTEIAALLGGSTASDSSRNGRFSSGGLPRGDVFELNDRHVYGPFADGSSIRYATERIYVHGADRADDSVWDEFDLPASRDKWIALEGTPFRVLVREGGRGRVWATYHAATAAR